MRFWPNSKVITKKMIKTQRKRKTNKEEIILKNTKEHT